MKNSALFKVLYFISSLLFCVLFFFVYYIEFSNFHTYIYIDYSSGADKLLSEIIGEIIRNPVFLINFILFIVFTVLTIKKRKLSNANIIFPILYMIFSFISILIGRGFDMFLPTIGILATSYYCIIAILFYIPLNIYSLLSFEKKEKRNKSKA